MMAPSRGTECDQTANADWEESGSETVGDKVHGREGKSPDRQQRSQNTG